MLHPLELEIVLAVQALFSPVLGSLGTLSSLGGTLSLLLAVPLLYWCVDPSIGLRSGILVGIAGGLNGALKLILHTPRPYWLSDRVLALDTTPTFSMPSGHAQVSIAILGYLAVRIRRRSVWVLATLLVLAVGGSRIILGAHFPLDVLAGWIAGAVILLLFCAADARYAPRLERLSPAQAVVLSGAGSLLLLLLFLLAALVAGSFIVPAPWIAHSTASVGTFDPFDPALALFSSGSIFGLSAGAALAGPGFSAASPLRERVRIPAGLLGVAVIWYGLGAAFPLVPTPLEYLLEYLRAALWGFWVTLGAPSLFSHLESS
ncbi:MAG: phosphatase PAP2 family protein [Methanomicrobiaceae archaeon]|nr:phosphatase PAP2 family protein [Methanomicrobiaceae archaeon]